MGKITGFLEFTRELPEKRPVAERVNDYKEFVHFFSEEKLNQQSARCMDCGVPFCHSGCPLGNVIPEFNDAVYRQEWKEAYDILISTNNFPEFTGRICPAPCETACVLGINQPAITIEEIERHIIEIAFEKGIAQPQKIKKRSGKKVAVVGSGPAGLAAAAQLNYAGHLVTVFERDDAAGGLLRYGIPDFKMEKWVVDRRIKFMEEEGVSFIYNANVGENFSLSDMLREYHAIVLACGSTVPRMLDIAGKELKGVYPAMQFLKQNNLRVANKKTTGRNDFESNNLPEDLLATGKHVVVIGGGDTGSDCVGTSNRHKAASITQFELLPTPPSERTSLMPWPSYPMLLKTTSSHEEGANRHWAIATKEFIGDENGNLKELKIADLEWKSGDDGRPATFIEKPGSERNIPCDLALLAMGFVHPQFNGLVEELGVELDERRNVRATEQEYKTNIHKIFACGDMRRGQSLVVWAISEGRECAARVDAFLCGETFLEKRNSSIVSQLV